MVDLNLSLAVTTNDRTRAIIDGSVRAQGIDLTVTAIANAGEIFWRQPHFKEFDASEMSLSEMIMLVSRGDTHWTNPRVQYAPVLPHESPGASRLRNR